MVPRRAGQFVRGRFRLLLAALISALAVAAVLVVAGFSWWPLSVVALAVMIVAGRLLREGKRLDPLPWRKGARGEEAVGRVLEAMRAEGYFDLHDVDTGHGNIDHVVIGPTGVVAVETKHWTGRFRPVKGRLHCNGRPCPEPLEQAQRGAMNVKRRLRAAGIATYVDAVVVSTNATVAKGLLTFREATVLQVDRLPEWLRTRSHPLSHEQMIRARAAILRWDAPVTVRSLSMDDAPPATTSS